MAHEETLEELDRRRERRQLVADVQLVAHPPPSGQTHEARGHLLVAGARRRGHQTTSGGAPTPSSDAAPDVFMNSRPTT